jgi:hypothetical protein
MTTTKRIAHGVWRWFTAWTPRWWTLMLAIFLAGSAFVTQNASEMTRQEQRVDSRCALRGAFFKLLDIADEATVAKGKPVSEASVDFRSYLNENYPPIIPDSECPK